MELACCHGKRYDVKRALKVLPSQQYEISFFGIFHDHPFTNTILINKKPFRASLNMPFWVSFEMR